ncbi:MAG TPA: BlaI/MecI/CopY family transcriptional regulator [Gemmatimonadales bacterium]|jgi:predicted transcriptional regulator|nr:BlaI/MecI/CopY family transcriptional regulator [Gemmatimonadales bacterium]
MMRSADLLTLSRRERQIMDVVYRLGQATAAEIHVALPDPPTYTSVRGLLRVLLEKGHLTYQEEGRRYVYRPSTPRPAAGASSLRHVVRTFFDGSPVEAMAALLGSENRISEAELARLAELVAKARTRKREASR